MLRQILEFEDTDSDWGRSMPYSLDSEKRYWNCFDKETCFS